MTEKGDIRMTIFENATNYIYKVEKTHDFFSVKSDSYLLFNPYISKWITIDDIGKNILLSISNHNDINKVKEDIVNKYNISHEVFDSDAVPFINDLIKQGFLCTQKNNVLNENVIKTPDISQTLANMVFESLYLSLEEGCNLKCIYCFNSEKRKARIKGTALTVKDIKSCFEHYKMLGGQGVVLTGGEPTLNSDFISICALAKNIGLNVSVITNGTLLNKFEINDIVKYIDNLSISIDSVEDIVQKELWNANNYSYNSNIKPFLVKFNEVAKKTGEILDITIMPVLTKLNISSLKDTIYEIVTLLDHVNVRWVITKYGEIGIDNIDKMLSISTFEYDKTIWNSMCDSVDEDTLIRYVLSRGGKDNIVIKPHSIMCNPSLFITHYGDVYPCQGLESDKFYLGNIKETKLTEIVTHEKFEKLRESLFINNVSYCKDCERRMVCTNSNGRPCNKYSNDRCKAEMIFRLYMMTQKSKKKDKDNKYE